MRCNGEGKRCQGGVRAAKVLTSPYLYLPYGPCYFSTSVSGSRPLPTTCLIFQPSDLIPNDRFPLFRSPTSFGNHSPFFSGIISKIPTLARQRCHLAVARRHFHHPCHHRSLVIAVGTRIDIVRKYFGGHVVFGAVPLAACNVSANVRTSSSACLLVHLDDSATYLICPLSTPT